MSPRVRPSTPDGAAADPLGKRALFGSIPTGTAAGGARAQVSIDPFAPAPRQGRQALYSDAGPGAPSAGRGLATVVCRSCETRTPLGPVGLLTRTLPSLWIPGRRWSRYLRCPACGRLSWARIEWGH